MLGARAAQVRGRGEGESAGRRGDRDGDAHGRIVCDRPRRAPPRVERGTSVWRHAANTPSRGCTRFATACLGLSREALPKSALGQAAAYTLNMWAKLRRCFDYAEVELSNNLAENSMRPVALGRKNWLHPNSAAAPAAAGSTIHFRSHRSRSDVSRERRRIIRDRSALAAGGSSNRDDRRRGGRCAIGECGVW